MTRFSAPWSNTLIATSTVFSLLLVGIALLGLLVGPTRNPLWLGSMVGLPLAIVLITALLSIRGYALEGGTLYVLRPAWRTPIPLTALTQAEVVPGAMAKSIRIWGNGGLFAFSGYFYNAALGQYRAYVTDPRRTVVLTLPTGKLVLSPAQPSDFINAVLPARPHG